MDKIKPTAKTHYVHWIVDDHFAGFAHAFTLLLSDSKRSRKLPNEENLGRESKY